MSRFESRPMSPEQLQLCADIRAKSEELADLFKRIKVLPVPVVDTLPAEAPGRYVALATTALEESCMWAVKAVSREVG